MDQTTAAEIESLKKQLQDKLTRGEGQNQRLPLLRELRAKLIAAIEKSDLSWFTLDLKMGKRTGPAQFNIQVCSPLRVGGFFVPVTPNETWDLAVKFDVLPLSQAVADQQVNEAADKNLFIEFKAQPADTKIFAYDEFTGTLQGTKYGSEYGSNPVSGSHKLWVLSALCTDDKPCNYGFYHKGPRFDFAQGNHGPYLYGEYSIVNGLIRAHDWKSHWDYSQLLQFMKDLREGVNLLNLRQAILDKHPAVWDEKLPFPARLLPGNKPTT